jgi:hypothetical protein
MATTWVHSCIVRKLAALDVDEEVISARRSDCRCWAQLPWT